MTEPVTPLYCANHPTVETYLRCNLCEKPICPKCAVSTPTGYRCKDCVRSQQKSFDTALWYDYLTSSLVAIVLSFIGSQIIPNLGFFTIILSPIAGVIIAELCRTLIRKRRSRKLYQVIAAATALGSAPYLFLFILSLSAGNFGAIIPLVIQALYSFLVTSTVYYRLSGINLKL